MARKRPRKRPHGDVPAKKKRRVKASVDDTKKQVADEVSVGIDDQEKQAAGDAKVSECAEEGLLQPKKPHVLMDVANIRFTQRGIFDTFNENKADSGSVMDLINAILNWTLAPSDIPLIRVAKKRGSYWSIDNRRLFVYKHCQLGKIPVEVWQWTDMKEFEFKWKNGQLTRGETANGQRVALTQRAPGRFPRSSVLDLSNSHVSRWFTKEEQEQHDRAIAARAASSAATAAAAAAKDVKRQHHAEARRLRTALGATAKAVAVTGTDGRSTSGAAAVELAAGSDSDGDAAVVELRFG